MVASIMHGLPTSYLNYRTSIHSHWLVQETWETSRFMHVFTRTRPNMWTEKNDWTRIAWPLKKKSLKKTHFYVESTNVIHNILQMPTLVHSGRKVKTNSHLWHSSPGIPGTALRLKWKPDTWTDVRTVTTNAHYCPLFPHFNKGAQENK